LALFAGKEIAVTLTDIKMAGMDRLEFPDQIKILDVELKRHEEIQ